MSDVNLLLYDDAIQSYTFHRSYREHETRRASGRSTMMKAFGRSDRQLVNALETLVASYLVRKSVSKHNCEAFSFFHTVLHNKLYTQ